MQRWDLFVMEHCNRLSSNFWVMLLLLASEELCSDSESPAALSSRMHLSIVSTAPEDKPAAAPDDTRLVCGG